MPYEGGSTGIASFIEGRTGGAEREGGRGSEGRDGGLGRENGVERKGE